MTAKPAEDSTPDGVPDEHLSVDDGPEVEIKIKASRFIGQVFRVASKEAVEASLLEVKKRFHDARHHCYAWRLGRPEAFQELAQDDGEPRGTAGIPILGALQREDLFDVLCVVTRYFGGTKLGSGGLVRAYGEAAALAVEEAPQRPVYRERRLVVTCGYDDVGAVEATIARRTEDLRGIDRDFSEGPRFLLRVIRSRTDALVAAIVEASNGAAACEICEEEND